MLVFLFSWLIGMEKPRLFIGSSSESYDVASACNACLDRKVEVTIWDKIFNSGGDTLTSLTEKAKNVDFALFIFRPEDLTMMRDNPKPTVRDNVLFELGLFIGALGKDRCFILKPRNEDLHMPTDLLGVNVNDYDPHRSDGDLESAVNAACTRFLKSITQLGSFSSKTKDEIKSNVFSSQVSGVHTISESMLRLLGRLLPTATENDYILPFHLSDGFEPYKLNINLIKLERLRLIEKILDSDMNGNEWYGYKLTQDGVEYILENEAAVDQVMCQYKKPPKQQVILTNFDDNIPF